MYGKNEKELGKYIYFFCRMLTFMSLFCKKVLGFACTVSSFRLILGIIHHHVYKYSFFLSRWQGFSEIF